MLSEGNKLIIEAIINVSRGGVEAKPRISCDLHLET